jgi:hypothetical protein
MKYLIILIVGICAGFLLIYRHQNQIGVETKILKQYEITSYASISPPFGIIVIDERDLNEKAAHYGIILDQLPDLAEYWNKNDCSILLTGGSNFKNISYAWPQSNYAFIELSENSKEGFRIYILKPRINRQVKCR